MTWVSRTPNASAIGVSGLVVGDVTPVSDLMLLDDTPARSRIIYCCKCNWFNNAELSCGRCTYFGCNHDFCEYCTGSVIVTPRISTAKRRTLRMAESDVLSQAGESQIARGVASEANRAKFFACKADIQEALARMTLDINTTFP